MLLSGVLQSHSVIHIHIYSFLDSFSLSDQFFWIIFGLTDGICNLPGSFMSHTFARYAKNVKPRLLLPAISGGFCRGNIPNNELVHLPLTIKVRNRPAQCSSPIKRKNKKHFIHLGTCAVGMGTGSHREAHEHHTNTLSTAFALRNKVLFSNYRHLVFSLNTMKQ